LKKNLLKIKASLATAEVSALDVAKADQHIKDYYKDSEPSDSL
jgi:hypothetical protein